MKLKVLIASLALVPCLSVQAGVMGALAEIGVAITGGLYLKKEQERQLAGRLAFNGSCWSVNDSAALTATAQMATAERYLRVMCLTIALPSASRP